MLKALLLSAMVALAPAYRFPSGEAPAREAAIDLPPRPIAVWFPADLPEDQGERHLRRLRGWLAQVPTAHVAALQTIAFDPREFPDNAKRGEKLGQPELKLWASARAGVMTFYRNDPPGDWQLSRRRVFHELGHCVAHATFGSSTPPAAWAEAVQADRTFFTSYSLKAFKATGSLVEDFADAYAAYMQGQIDGGEAQAAFLAAYPHRGQVLQLLLP